MSWMVALQPREMESFRHCRRAWDFSASTRQNYVPTRPPEVFDFDKAIHEALGVYYFPAMDDWDRSIVRPLALQGFHRSMRRDRELYERSFGLSAEQEQKWREQSELGQAVLEHYFLWAAMVDEFDSVLSAQDVWAPVPDPCSPGNDLTMPDGRPLRYFGRVEQLIADTNDEFWVVDHRIVRQGWHDADQFLLDMEGLSYVWALELSYPQLKVAGTVYNELRIDAHEGRRPVRYSEVEERDKRDMRGARRANTRRGPASVVEAGPAQSFEDDDSAAGRGARDRTEIARQEGNEHFRRTHVRRSRASIEDVGVRIAAQMAEMTDPEVPLYPNPSDRNCPLCAYRTPCMAMNDGVEPGPILVTQYRKRSKSELDPGHLRWSSARGGTPAALSGRASRSQAPGRPRH